MMKCIIIAAVAENGAIGKDNKLIWDLPDDMRFFKEQTTGKPVIMGRKNYESIPEKYRPLPKRPNIIITRNTNYEAPGSAVFNDLNAAIESQRQKGVDETYIIGGAEIYNLALKEDRVDEMYLTRIHASFEADTFFPAFDKKKWEVKVILLHEKDERHAHSFTIEHWLRKSHLSGT